MTFAYTDANNPTQPSSITDTSGSRTIAWSTAGPSGALSKITDATGAVTTLGYDATGLISLTNNGNQTSFGYDPSSRLTSWTFGAGSAATSQLDRRLPQHHQYDDHRRQRPRRDLHDRRAPDNQDHRPARARRRFGLGHL